MSEGTWRRRTARDGGGARTGAGPGSVADVFCLNFVAGLPGIGEPLEVALVEDGADIPVTEDNRRDYVEAYVDCLLNSSIERQVWGAACACTLHAEFA